ncbi:MAG: NADH-quinone oxidoreductase subunit K [Vicinamibacterales bacterium]
MTETAYLLSGAALVALGAFYAFASVERIRQVIAVNVLGNGVFLILLTRAWASSHGAPDPVPQALVLTGIVVAAAATGLALALARALAESEDEP